MRPLPTETKSHSGKPGYVFSAYYTVLVIRRRSECPDGLVERMQWWGYSPCGASEAGRAHTIPALRRSDRWSERVYGSSGCQKPVEV